MARLEDLIAEIETPALRDAVAHEVKTLKERTSFGLVFERHLPESVLVPPGAGLGEGDEVRMRQQPDDARGWRVKSRSADSVALVDEAGEETTVPLDDVLVLKGFGESVYPTLTPLGTIERSEERPYHTVINGENYHALQVMQHCWEGQVDCIYIDPPYNTGARDWKYNNDYVDNTDTWHHSKWLSMMEKRLRLAKKLLKPDGVLICTIDEHEVHHLAGLLEMPGLFREYLRYMVTIVINPKGTAKVNFGRVDEYAFFVVPNTGTDVIAPLPPPDDAPDAAIASEAMDADEESAGPWTREVGSRGEVPMPAALRRALGVEEGEEVELSLREDGVAEVVGLVADEEEAAEDEELTASADGETISKLHLRRRGAGSSSREKRWRQFYAIKVDEKTKTVVGLGPVLGKEDPYELGHKEGDVLWLYPVDEEGGERVWRHGRDTMQSLIEAGDIKVGMYAPQKPQPYTLNHYKKRTGQRLQRIRTVWWRTAHDAGTHGTTLLSRLLGERTPFPFPKSVYAVRDCLEAVVGNRKDALIVDFFAGSATTLHATALLNEADGGRRRCVLATNNEVDEETAKRLNDAGHFRGDPEFEKHGIFEGATRPRIEATLTGIRPDGTKIRLSGRQCR